LQQGQHLRLNIYCQHFALGHQGSNAAGKVNRYQRQGRPTTSVGLRVEGGDRRLGPFLQHSAGAIEPTCSLVAHGLGDLSAQVDPGQCRLSWAKYSGSHC
jgi:hypothetical protein